MTNFGTTNEKESNMTKRATVVTRDDKKRKGVLPVTAHRSNSGARMRMGILPVAYWVNGDGTGRTFYGVTREHAFQRALKWGRVNWFEATAMDEDAPRQCVSVPVDMLRKVDAHVHLKGDYPDACAELQKYIEDVYGPNELDAAFQGPSLGGKR